MEGLFLSDLSSLDEAGVKKHISEEYSGDLSGFDYGSPSDKDKEKVSLVLDGYDVLVAYENVGSWGCDSTSYFLLKNKKDGSYSEFSGGHCSCYGFEGQFDLQDATIEYLKSDKFSFYCGGYDDNETENQKAVKEFIMSL